MKNVTRIILLMLCSSLALSSCNKKVHTPDPQDQKTPIGFSAVSETSTVKSSTEATTSLSEFHQDFGVWGIARHSSSTIQPYVLWPDNPLEKVSLTTTGLYEPSNAAYWLVGYTYNFLAIAPYDSGATDLEIDQDNNQITFTYDLREKYKDGDYDFDLMAAAAETEVTSSRTTSQELTFWHIFSKININISFVDASNNPATGSVSQMRLCNVGSAAAYTITSDSGALSVDCGTPSQTTDLTFSGSSAAIHILPQTITGFELYIDFERDGVAYQDFKANLSFGVNNPSEYNHNEVYNWNITIGPKNAISFSVEVGQWSSDKVNDTDIDII